MNAGKQFYYKIRNLTHIQEILRSVKLSVVGSRRDPKIGLKASFLKALNNQMQKIL